MSRIKNAFLILILVIFIIATGLFFYIKKANSYHGDRLNYSNEMGVSDCISQEIKGNDCSIYAKDDSFITTWELKENDKNEYTAHIRTLGGGYNYSIDCDNDGSFEYSSIKTDFICKYTKAGIYKIRITGYFPRIFFYVESRLQQYSEKNTSQLISIDQWGTNKWRSMEGAFAGCKNLKIHAHDNPNLSETKSLKNMFWGATSFNQDISAWDVSMITDMSGMFANATAFNKDISRWNVSKVTDMSKMFAGATSFNQDISNWDVSAVTDMSGMFEEAIAFNQNIGRWNVSKVADTKKMFGFAISFNRDISGWDVQKVKNMSAMFFSAKSFNQNLGKWNIKNVRKMQAMFEETNLSTENYDAILEGWSNADLQKGVRFDAGSTRYCQSEKQREKIIRNYLWIITDGGKELSCRSR